MTDCYQLVKTGFSITGEFGGGGTAQFLNPQDSQTICGPGGCPVNLTPIPEPSSTAAIGLTGLAMLGYGWRRRKGSK
ncbi:MAG: PEP-CTERM sorting domain-containing protein [Microcystis aeruginosa G13-07]|nr:PEP-CTERM sorting domain-containing protein [Microcystis aeruginosa G13-07]